MTVLDNAQCALIVGAKDTGKTTLLKHVIARRLSWSHVLILDPHSHPSRWPPGCQIVGTERQFDQIANALQALMSLMNKRYRDIGKGLVQEGEHESVTVIIDEWRAIVYQLGKSAADAIKTLLVESRKTNINMFVGTHSERVKALGIEGEGDLKDGFVMVRLRINQATNQRSATLDYGDGEIDVDLPGPFIDPYQERQFLEISAEPEPNDNEALVLQLYDEGETRYNEIARQVYGSVGGKQTQRIKQTLQKFGRVPCTVG